jgi:hypothetical protein
MMSAFSLLYLGLDCSFELGNLHHVVLGQGERGSSGDE